MSVAETNPVRAGDGPDDPAIWIHPNDPAQSTIIVTNKEKEGGLIVYDLDGCEIQILDIGSHNNVDLRYNFPLNGGPVTLVTAGNRADNTLSIYRVNPETRRLEDVAARKIPTTVFVVYGTCMYRSNITGVYYAFLTSKSTGNVVQFELYDDGNGSVDADLVRTFNVGSQTEGCVADDITGNLYLAEECVGIWKYGAEPYSGCTRVLIDEIGPGGHLTPDVEGLALYYATEETGYLIASSQGDSLFVIYKRERGNDYIGAFAIDEGNGIDGVSGTDGIDVVNVPLGANYPSGLFVAQDDKNSDISGTQNFKLVSWEDIAHSFVPNLYLSSSRNSR